MSSAPELRSADRIDGNESHWAAYDAAGIQLLLEVEDRHFWFRARNEIIAGLVVDPIRHLPSGFRILEVGCGSGNVLRTLHRLGAGRGHVEGVEVSAAACEVARDRTGLVVTNGHLADMPTLEPYDIIAAFDVLEHIADEAAVLGQMRERLAQRGRLILTVPAHPSLWSSFDVASEHYRRYTPRTLTKALVASGFEIEYLTYFMSILFAPMWLRRRLIRAERPNLGAVYDTEFTIVPVLNRVAYEMLRQDAHLLQRRVRVPMGTSLAVIARPVR